MHKIFILKIYIWERNIKFIFQTYKEIKINASVIKKYQGNDTHTDGES